VALGQEAALRLCGVVAASGLSTGADGGIWSPDGKNIVFVSSVYPDAKDDAENIEWYRPAST
jgi:Tol biopolymer transport system component